MFFKGTVTVEDDADGVRTVVAQPSVSIIPHVFVGIYRGFFNLLGAGFLAVIVFIALFAMGAYGSARVPAAWNSSGTSLLFLIAFGLAAWATYGNVKAGLAAYRPYRMRIDGSTLTLDQGLVYHDRGMLLISGYERLKTPVVVPVADIETVRMDLNQHVKMRLAQPLVARQLPQIFVGGTNAWGASAALGSALMMGASRALSTTPQQELLKRQMQAAGYRNGAGWTVEAVTKWGETIPLAVCIGEEQAREVMRGLVEAPLGASSTAA